jgi:TM2 domain-containing membrane protein YozV
MIAVGIIVNIFFPGVGTLIVGKIGQGIAQLLLFIFGAILNFTVIGAVIGIPLCFAMWVWGLVSAATAKRPSSERFRD